jgi:hypothetical protein
VKWIFLSIVALCIAALSGFGIYTFGWHDRIDRRSQPAVSSRPNPPPPDPNDVRSYYSTDGSRPRLFPTCNGVLGICLGTPLERVRGLLGVEDSRSGAGGDVYRTWTIGHPGITLTLSTDEVKAVKFLTAAVGPKLGGFRVGLPKHMVMGHATIGDVLRAFGKPLRQRKDAAETQVFYSLRYYAGGEGTEFQNFGYATLYGSKSDPKGFNPALRSRPVNTYTLCSASADC